MYICCTEYSTVIPHTVQNSDHAETLLTLVGLVTKGHLDGMLHADRNRSNRGESLLQHTHKFIRNKRETKPICVQYSQGNHRLVYSQL